MRHRRVLSASQRTGTPLRAVEDQPSTIGRFEIEAVIGRGGMSDVYRAFDPQLGRHVALKVLSPMLGRNREFKDRFIREAKSAAALNHPHIIPIFEAGTDGDTLFIAMLLVEGIDLKAHLEAHGPLEPAVLGDVIAQAADALDHAHDNGLLHRDVKPSNLLLEKREGGFHVYLSDFGLTKSLGTDSRITQTGDLVGSVHYVSPEHVEGRELDPRSDIYSLGCVVFECVSGRPPFERDTDLSVLWAHLNGDIPRPSKGRRNIPNLVDRVVARAMAKDRDERFSTCRDLAASLKSALQGVASGLPVLVKKQRVSLLGRMHTSIGVAAAFLLVGLAIVTAVSDWSPELPYTPSVSDLGQPASEGGSRAESTAARTPSKRDVFSANRVRGQQNESSERKPQLAAGSTDGGPALSPSVQGDQDGLAWTRTERENYDFRSSDLGLGEPCPTDDTSTAGCMQFILTPKERFVDVVITDQSGFDVGAFIRQDYDDDPYWDGPATPLCNATEMPVEVKPGARVQVWIDPQGCGGDSSPWTGVIVARLFKVI